MQLNPDQDFPHPNPYLPVPPRRGANWPLRIALFSLLVAVLSFHGCASTLNTVRYRDPNSWMLWTLLGLGSAGAVAFFIALQDAFTVHGWRRGKVVPAIVGSLQPHQNWTHLAALAVGSVIEPAHAGLHLLKAMVRPFSRRTADGVTAVWVLDGKIYCGELMVMSGRNLKDGDFIWVAPSKPVLAGPRRGNLPLPPTDRRVAMCPVPPQEAQEWLVANVAHALEPNEEYPQWVKDRMAGIASSPPEEAPVELGASDFGLAAQLPPHKSLNDRYDRKPPK